MKNIKGNKYATIHFGVNKYGMKCARLALGKKIKYQPSWLSSVAYNVLIEDIENAHEIIERLDEDGEIVLNNTPSDLPVLLPFAKTKMTLKFEN